MTVIELPRRAKPSSNPVQAITLSVATSLEATGISREDWDKFVLDANGDIYASYDWCRIWWRHYGRGRSLRILVIHQQDRLVGLAAMFIERIGIGPFSIKIAKPVGADFAMDVFGLPVLAAFMDLACGQIVSHLVERDNCDAVWFGFAPASHPSLDSLRRLAGTANARVAIARDAHAGVLTAFDLPDRFDSYIAALGKAARQNFRRQMNLLKKAGSVEQTVIRTPIDLANEFRAFSTMHTAQWQAEGLPGHFNDWPGSDAFNQELALHFASHGRLRLVRLKFEGKLVAAQYAFAFGSSGYWRLAARATDRQLGRYGLGVLGLMQLLEQMYDDGMQRVEGGYGRYPYKLQYGAREHAVRSLLLKSTRPISSVRAGTFVGLSALVNLFYYRIWRLRLAPKLPLRSAPLWRLWIRFRM